MSPDGTLQRYWAYLNNVLEDCYLDMVHITLVDPNSADNAVQAAVSVHNEFHYASI